MILLSECQNGSVCLHVAVLNNSDRAILAQNNELMMLLDVTLKFLAYV